MPEAIRSLVHKVIQQTAKKRREFEQLQRCWRRLVGEDLALHTKLAGLRKGKLYVQVDEPGTSFVLNLKAPKLLAQLQKALDCQIDELVVRPGKV